MLENNVDYHKNQDYIQKVRRLISIGLVNELFFSEPQKEGRRKEIIEVY